MEPLLPTSKPDETVETALQHSAFVFATMDSLLKSSSDEEPTLSIKREDVIKVKRAAARFNRSVSKLARASFRREDRLVVELYLIKQMLTKENTDREATRCRVFERLRVDTLEKNQQTAIDKAITSVERTEVSLDTLSPNGTLNQHGGPMIALFDK